ncbi:MAG: Gfo/Idh/MocA family oxidoreductase, partial [Victivallales bacterium]|nr:Gfo/Idh/MocA family oxidoreductase [Victivallales bacterium]
MREGKIKSVGIAVLGAGGRGRGVVKNLLRDSQGDVEVVSVYDPDKSEAVKSLKCWGFENAHVCDSHEDAVDKPGVDWAMVFSPNVYHKE